MIAKNTLFLALFVSATLLSGLKATAQYAYPPAEPAAPGYGPPPGHYHGERRVVRAVYGARGRYVDVTDIVRGYAHRGIPFVVSNDTFGVDPYRGERKHLRVTMVRPDGDQVERSWEEGDRVRL
ncbi:MAG TPA: hypothetical protein VE860_27265 [Chthoniobacterales bacterium]|jgi:hypothetical protein|nr:hypothetical protein [Chthoniobacterales bacterium]